ncbi:MAG: hypothetical protein ACLP07_00020 [Terracidiphilus sp.]
MSSHHRSILQLLAVGRINSIEAERLLIAASAEREAAWVLVGCVVVAAASQLHSLLPFTHFLGSMLAGSLPALRHVLTSITVSLGG